MAAVLSCFRRRVRSSGGRGDRGMLPVSAVAALLAALCVAAAAAALTPARAATSAVSGAMYAWGDNSFEELGDGTSTQHDSPEAVTLATGVTATAVSAGGDFGQAIGSDGNLYAWGTNTSGELGDGTTTSHNSPEVITLATGVKPTATSTGGVFSLAIGSDGDLYAWGDNTGGELGDGTLTQHDSPEQVTLATGVKPTAISAAEGSGGGGSGDALAIGSDGKLYAWGDNSGGQLGDGTTTNHNTPEAITLATGVKPTAISAGTVHSLAIGSDGKLYAWGTNNAGELGDGTTTQHDSPEAVTLATGVTATAVSAGNTFSLAIGSDGKLYAWGNNALGELGDGTTTGHNTPEAVTLATGVKPTAISAAAFDAMAIGSDGNLYAWGSNNVTIDGTPVNLGELGDGTTANHDSPEVITLATGVVPVAVSAGLFDTLAIGATCAGMATPAPGCPTPTTTSTTPTSSQTPTSSHTPRHSQTATSSDTTTSSPAATSAAPTTTAPTTPAASTSTPAAAPAVQATSAFPVGAPATGGGTGTEFSGAVAAAGVALIAAGTGLVVQARRRSRRRPPL